jgi:hypothetical protein
VTQTRLTRAALLVSSGLAAGAGFQLFVGTEDTDRFFAWTIQPPLTAAFLGGAYWGALGLIALAARERQWVNARVALIATITLVVLLFVVTLAHLERFHTDSDDALTLVGTWIFISTYGWLPVLLLAALVAQLRAGGEDPPRTAPLATWMRATLAVHGTLLLGFGISFLIAPVATAVVWPWTLTPLTGRALGAWLFAVGVAATAGLWENDWRRIRAPLAAYVALAVLEAVALVRYPGTPDWGHPGAWAIAAVLASMLAVGVAGLRIVAGYGRATASTPRGESTRSRSRPVPISETSTPSSRSTNST